MLDISFSQIIVVSGITLMVIKPEKMVDAFRGMGRFFFTVRSQIGEFKHQASELKREVKKEIGVEELKAIREDFQRQIDELEKQIPKTE